MKKIFLIAIIFLSLSVKAGDSTEVTLTLQSRDWCYIGSYINANSHENLFDSLKVKFRPVVPGYLVNVSVKVLTIDILNVYNFLKNDVIALTANCTARVRTALTATGDAYIITKLSEIDVNNDSLYDMNKVLGRNKLGRIR